MSRIIDGWTVIEYDLTDFPEKPCPYAVEMRKGDKKVWSYGNTIDDAIRGCQQEIQRIGV